MSSRRHGPPLLLVHGLWMGRSALWWHGRRARRAGFVPTAFRYASIHGAFGENVEQLRDAIVALEARHVLAHSLGGLVVAAALGALPSTFGPGRAVLLGSPLAGSRVARRLRERALGRRLLGRAADALCTGIELTVGGWQVYQIAGSRRVGLGLLAGGGRRPGDGTVALEETRAESLAGRLELPVSHTGLLFSPRVSEAALALLRRDPETGPGP